MLEQETELESSEEVNNPFIGRFESFFRAKYKKELKKLTEDYPKKRSLFVDFKKLERYDYELSDEFLINPDYLLKAASIAVQNMDIRALGLEEFKPCIRFFDLPGEKRVLLHDICSMHIGKLIAVEGLVRTRGNVLSRLKIAIYECRRCGNKYRTIQSGQTVQQPRICECKHCDFDLVAEESTFIDYQKVQVQEPLGLLNGSKQATSLEVDVTDDLVNAVKPGDRVIITGILKPRAPRGKRAICDIYLEAIGLEGIVKAPLKAIKVSGGMSVD